MDRPLKTQAIKKFLEYSTHADLAALYNHNMEVQVIVDQDGGTRTDGEFKGRQWHGFTDGLTTWKPIRIPYKADSNPEWTDNPINYDLAEHALGVGMTGWDWVSRASRWVGFDFDAITGHADTHKKKLSETELKEVSDLVWNIPWVTMRKSTSGQGLHLYVHMVPFPTANHLEHAAVARAILGVLSGLVGVDLSLKADACGGNMWVWHRKMLNTDGLCLLKQGSFFQDVPTNWRDHLKVISGKRRKILPTFIEESDTPDAEQVFEELTGQRSTIKLDEEHKKLISWLYDNGHQAIWDADHHMLITHTYGLAQAHEELQLRGVFKTMAHGSESGDHNAFAFPLRKGAWAIRRYTPGVAEDSTWQQDGAGWTRCYFNREPDLATASRTHEGNEHPNGGYHFRHAEQATKAALMLGADIKLPPYMLARSAKLKDKDGKLVVEVLHEGTDNPNDMSGWIQEGKTWKRVYNVQLSAPVSVETANFDDVVRHVVTETGDDYGWVLQSDNLWRTEPLTHIRVALEGSFGLGQKDVKAVLGGSVFKPWILVNRPFQPEYPGDRTWNRGAAQFRFNKSSKSEDLCYPTWRKILNHIGRGLDDAISENGWAKANGVLTGADYLKCWIASLFQEPEQPLPYLFLYSKPQNTGKSILHEGLAQLVTHGVVRADMALINQSGFNGELENAVLCVVEETDLRRHKLAYNRIKDWVTSRQLPIHRKGRTPYSIPNTTHWLQCANDHQACPVFSGDTRITMIQVHPLELEDIIPKKALLPLLEKEAPDFLAEMLSLEIPQSNDRLNVPVITTEDKIHAESVNKSYLEMFLEENVHRIDGSIITIADFYERFREWLDPSAIAEWSKIRVGREMPPHFPKGRNPKNAQWCFGNISWKAMTPGDTPLPRLIVRNEMLIASDQGNGRRHR